LPATEVCDGLDNDCNGQVDEGCACAAGETQPCYSGDLGTQGIGACKDGSQTCDLAGAWGACAGEILPASEVCNGVDDDCNGTADDMGDLTCGFGVCTVTVSACEGGVPGTCVPKAPSTEICDGLDNDCNQLVDETFPAQGSACDSGLLGVCQPGARQCVAAGGTASEQCVPVQIPTMEACDGLDNDCDGAADDSVPGTGGACATGLLGQCQQGTVLCQGGVVDCHPNIAPAPEVCDGQDNNCDGTVDEGCPLTFSGIQNNLPIAQLVGWSLCYMDTYANQSTTLSTIFTQCNKAKLLLGCRVTGDSTLIVAANAPRADVLLDTGFGNATHDANGVSWYYNTSSSMGFVYQGGAILKNSCDLNSANGSSRLCWHTTGGYLNTGWRCGTTTDLNFIATHERLVFHRD